MWKLELINDIPIEYLCDPYKVKKYKEKLIHEV